MSQLHPRPFVPFMVAAAGIGTFSLMDAAMKDLALSMGAYNAVMWRNTLGALLMGLLFVGTRQKWPSAHLLKIHLWRSIVVCSRGWGPRPIWSSACGWNTRFTW